ncbi:creatinase aminopeptidase [Phaffia rhodozyma]|uniref:Creatinase aminopeptidase n=1 Tax=Phaffia rhodozyma TaxID=264483 RepID=A0A0F7SIZ9_PHARH|nr:creatinase aminopeptidase [Phaffia rhodozyma]
MLISDSKVDAYVVPSEDEHLSETPADSEHRLAFITGFTGSAGTAVITNEDNWLYVDSRYWIQASRQVSSSWKVKRVGKDGQKNWAEDLIENAMPVLRLGIDPKLITAGSSAGAHSASVGSLLEASNIHVIPLSENLVDRVWGDSRPARSKGLIGIHPFKFAGKSSVSKLQELLSSKYLEPSKTIGLLVSSLDEIAWLLNLRCEGDVKHLPVFYSYLWISTSSDTSRTLFVDPSKVSEPVREYLRKLNVVVKPYEQVWAFLKWIKAGLSPRVEDLKEKNDDKRKVVTGLSVSWEVELSIGKENLQTILSPIKEARAIKNPIEIQGLKAAYLRDGRASIRWMAEMDRSIRKEKKAVDEWEAADLLTTFRSKEKYFKGLAYDNISGSGPNGALPHYSPEKRACRVIDRDTFYVNDSGAQYLDGTIDTTRTFHFGTPTQEMRRAFTRVLQGHIAVANSIFPEGTTGVPMNILARGPLWKDHLDFGHGMVYIGSYLAVHEGPQGIPTSYPFKPGHIISDEPGYYKEGHWGIRIESVILCVEQPSKAAHEGTWLGWDLITRVPILPSLVDKSLLSLAEKQWLKNHNELCKKDLMPLLTDEGDGLARKFLGKI